MSGLDFVLFIFFYFLGCDVVSFLESLVALVVGGVYEDCFYFGFWVFFFEDVEFGFLAKAGDDDFVFVFVEVG